MVRLVRRGLRLIIRLPVEVLIIPFSALQAFFGVVGVLIAVVTLLTSVRDYSGVSLGG